MTISHFGTSEIEVRLSVPGVDVRGVLLFEDGDTLVVLLPQGQRFAKPILSKVQLHISNGNFTKEIQSRLSGRRRTPEGEVCSFRSSRRHDPGLVHQILRRTPRVRVNESTSATLSPAGGQSVEAVMIDISASGAGMFVLEEVETELSNVVQVDCHFELTDISEVFMFPAAITLRHLDGAQVRYGLEFVQTDSDYSRQAELLREYVATRQIRELRRRRS